MALRVLFRGWLNDPDEEFNNLPVSEEAFNYARRVLNEIGLSWHAIISERGGLADTVTPGGLTFSKLRATNVKRCEAVFFGLQSWSPTDWGCALAGEVGELCNKLKEAAAWRAREQPGVCRRAG